MVYCHLVTAGPLARVSCFSLEECHCFAPFLFSQTDALSTALISTLSLSVAIENISILFQ